MEWDTDLAFERARVAYRFVAANFPDEADLEILATYTVAAHAGERAADMEAYEEARREPCWAWRWSGRLSWASS
jgi:hypothetical protein